LQHDGVRLAGWVANQCDPHYPSADATVDYLATVIRAPLAGTIRHLEPPAADAVAPDLDVTLLAVR
jgi:dethiobiotin synthetase